MSFTRSAAGLAFAAIIACATVPARSEVRQAGQGAAAPAWATKDLRAGIIGTDTSHVPQFTAMFNRTKPEWRIKVVAAFKGGSPDLPTSADRLEEFAKTIREEHGVEIVDSIDALLAKVDVVLLESVDGRPHLAQVTPVFKARKRVFIDKPLASSLDDVRRIVQLSTETGTPFFSSSSYRFYPDVVRLRRDPGVGKVLSVQASSPFNILAFHPDLFFYGIHGIEALYAVMGTGCVNVTRKVEGAGDVTSCTWKDGRVGSYFGALPDPGGSKSAPNARPPLRIVGEKGTAEAAAQGGYEGLVVAIAEFFQTGRPPFDVAETIEIFEFMTAAQVSKERGGAPVPLASLRK
jgi:predicted dehydrogenase